MRIDVVYFDGGGGHRSAAMALHQVCRDQQRPWDMRLVNLRDILGPLDPCNKMCGVRAEDVYNRMLKEGWTLGAAQWKPLYHLFIALTHSAQVRLLERYWEDSRPDLVVSLIPHFNRALRESLLHVAPATPYVTILTDIADYPPHFWIERQPQDVICGSARAAAQAKAFGYPHLRIWRVSGMIVHPRFYQAREIDRGRERKRLGLDPDLPTGLVLFGGEGSNAMLRIARRLGEARLGVQLILLCGRNAALASELRRLRLGIPACVEGFTDDVPYYMRLADFFIGKPGPGCLSEAVVMGLPVIVERNAWTLPQERYNTEWVEDNRLGIVVQSFSQVGDAVRRLLNPAKYNEFRRNVAAQAGRAVFQIPGILERISGDSVRVARPLFVQPGQLNQQVQERVGM